MSSVKKHRVSPWASFAPVARYYMITRIGVSVLQGADITCCLGNRAGRSIALLSEDPKAPEPANGTQACRVRRMASGESDKHVR